MQLIEGKQDRPQKVLIYGVEGIGKSTLASKFPAPVFIDVEDRTAHLDIKRFAPKNFLQVKECINFLLANDHGFKTVVLDTADWTEQLVEQHVCTTKNKTSIEDFGYGKGYKLVQECVRELLQDLHKLQYKKAMHIVVLAHAKIKRFDDPQLAVAYDRYQLKCSDSVSAIFREWADAVLFANYQTIVTTGDDKKERARAGRNRMLFCQHTAAFDAKNSYGLPDEIKMDYELLKPYIQTDYAENLNYTPLSDEEIRTAKQKFLDQCVTIAGGDTSFISAMLKKKGTTLKAMTVTECEKFVLEVMAAVAEKVNNKEKEDNHE
jgi:GTPase SAR1 family protein